MLFKFELTAFLDTRFYNKYTAYKIGSFFGIQVNFLITSQHTPLLPINGFLDLSKRFQAIIEQARSDYKRPSQNKQAYPQYFSSKAQIHLAQQINQHVSPSFVLNTLIFIGFYIVVKLVGVWSCSYPTIGCKKIITNQKNLYQTRHIHAHKLALFARIRSEIVAQKHTYEYQTSY